MTSYQLPSDPNAPLAPAAPAAGVSPVVPPVGMPWSEAGDGEGIKLTGLLHSLRRRWLPALGLGILAATSVAALLWMLIPVNFEALSILRVNREVSSPIGDRYRSYGTIQDYNNYKQTQAMLLRSPYVISIALRDRAINQLPMISLDKFGRRRTNSVAWLADEIKVDLAGESEILQVRLSGENPDHVKAVLDAVVKSYLAEIVNREKSEKLSILDMLRQRYADNQAAMRQKSDQLHELAVTFGSPDLAVVRNQHQIDMEQMRYKKLELDRLQSELDAVEIELAQRNLLLQYGQVPISDFAVLDELERDPEYAAYQMQVKQLEDQIRQAGERIRPGSPQFNLLNQEVEIWQTKLQERDDELRPRIIERIRRQSGDSVQVSQRDYYAQGMKLQMLNQKVTQARSEYLDLFNKVGNVGEYSGNMDALAGEVKTLQRQTEELKLEIDRLDLEVRTQDRIRVVQAADVPDVSNFMFKLTEVIVAWGMTFLGVVAGIAYWDYLSKLVNTTQDVNSTTALRIIGTLPELQPRGLIQLPFKRPASQDALNYSIDTIRTALLYNRQRTIRVAMITSAAGQEGRTTVASQLAASMARSGRRTLLIDGDFRNPQLHLVFGQANENGLCELLRGELQTAEAVKTTTVENLWLLPAGVFDQNSIQALSHNIARQIFEELRGQFDCVVIDAAPVLTSADALLVGQFVDSSILSVRRDVSRLPKVNAACERLMSVGIHVIGAVLNGESTEVRAGERSAAPQEQIALPT